MVVNGIGQPPVRAPSDAIAQTTFDDMALSIAAYDPWQADAGASNLAASQLVFDCAPQTLSGFGCTRINGWDNQG
jgi:hypothetical protein